MIDFERALFEGLVGLFSGVDVELVECVGGSYVSVCGGGVSWCIIDVIDGFFVVCVKSSECRSADKYFAWDEPGSVERLVELCMRSVRCA